MLRGGLSEPRNGALMKMFHLIGYGERAGSGVPDIYATWDNAGFADPIVEEQFGNGQPNRTIVTLPLIPAKSADQPADPADQPADPINMKAQHKQILSILEIGKPYSSNEIASMIGLKGSRTRELLKEMVELGYIESTSATNGRRYIKK